MFKTCWKGGRRWVLACGAAMVLAACGGGDNPAPAPVPPQLPADPVGPGEFKASTLLGTVTSAEVAQALSASSAAALALKPVYAVTSYRIEYLTTDADGQPVRASGLVSVPVKPSGSTSPVLGYQHGTIFHDADAPSNHAVASEVAVVLASLGYIVVAPDYVGYGVSKGSAHPYLLSSPSAAATVDLLTAAKTWRRHQQVPDNGQLFLTGYSEGGYVTLAAQRAMQATQSQHLASLKRVVVGSGPYNVQVTLDGLLRIVRDENPIVGALINPGFLRYLGGSAQREVRRLILRQLVPDDADVVMDTRFLDYFLSDDVAGLEQISNVHDWRPTVPVDLFHGRDDRTVPYASSQNTWQAMQARGAGSGVTLTDCTASPASHSACVAPFIGFMLGRLAPQASHL